MHSEVVVGRDHWNFSGTSHLNMILCDTLVKEGTAEAAAISKAWAHGYQVGLIHPPDSAILKALVLLKAGEKHHKTGQDEEPGKSNGAALCAAPLAFLLDPAQDQSTLKSIFSITHLEQEAIDAAFAVVYAIRFLRDNEVNFLPLVVKHLPDGLVKDKLSALLSEKETSLASVVRKHPPSREAVASVPLALYAAWRSAALGFDPVIRVLAGAGNGADSWCSIAGQVAGALLGTEALPADWLRRIRIADHYEDFYESVVKYSAFVQSRQGIQTLF